jgi:transglutaminase-like putative cysteine protease
MRLAVSHRTVFHYAAPVGQSVNTLRLEPRAFPYQKTLSALVRVLPATRVRRFTDLFANITHHFELTEPHTRLEIDSRIRVRNLPLDIPEAALVADASGHREFRYDSDATEVNTRTEDAFARRHGVCQDFTHVMLGLCRSVGIAARYASGYLYNGPRDHLIGAQASHAWCEVYLPGAGWIGFDPTNNTLADERYVKAAVGRDYDEVAPVTGTYVGTSHRRMEVTVVVEKL